MGQTMREQRKGVCTESERQGKKQPGDYAIKTETSKVGVIKGVKCYRSFRSLCWSGSLELQKKTAFGGDSQRG